MKKLFVSFIILHIIIILINISCHAQNIALGIGFGYSSINVDFFDVNIINSVYKPAIGYEAFGYFSIPLFNDINLIFGVILISKGFNLTDVKKYELLYLQPMFAIRFLKFKDIYSKTFLEVGFNLFGKLLENFVLDYNDFSVSYDNSINFSSSDNSLNFGTGIIIKNIIVALNIYLQLDTVLIKEINSSVYNFYNYNMILSIAIII